MDERWQVSPRRPDGARGRRRGDRGFLTPTPTKVTLTIALLGSIVFVLYSLTVRDPSQIPMLSAGSGVLGIVFAALTVAGAVGTYRAALEGRQGQAFGLAVLGGLAGLLAAGSFAAAVILALVWRDKPT